MMRDEVLEQVAATLEDHAERMGGWAPFVDKGVVYRSAAGVARALKSNPPEKSPEVEPVMERMQANEWLVQLHDMTKERDALRRELPQYDCRRTGGPGSDSGGKHCPQEAPCLTCRLERAEAEVSRLKWEAAGSPMPGEPPRSE